MIGNGDSHVVASIHTSWCESLRLDLLAHASYMFRQKETNMLLFIVVNACNQDKFHFLSTLLSSFIANIYWLGFSVGYNYLDIDQYIGLILLNIFVWPY